MKGKMRKEKEKKLVMQINTNVKSRKRETFSKFSFLSSAWDIKLDKNWSKNLFYVQQKIYIKNEILIGNKKKHPKFNLNLFLCVYILSLLKTLANNSVKNWKIFLIDIHRKSHREFKDMKILWKSFVCHDTVINFHTRKSQNSYTWFRSSKSHLSF